MSWPIIELKYISKVQAGQSAPKKEFFSKSGVPFIRAGSLESLLLGKKESELELIRQDDVKKLKMKIYPKGTIVFAKSGMSATLGRIYQLKGECCVVSHLATVVASEKVSSDFLKFWFIANPPMRLINDPAYPSIRASDIEDLKISLPPLTTQKKIAAVLEKADQLRKDCQQMEQELNSLAQSVFIDMFGDPVMNPKGWTVKTLDDVCCDIYRYPTFYGFDYVDEGIPVIKIGNITTDGYVGDDLSKYDFMPESISRKYPRTILKLGDIVMAVRGDGSTGKRIGLVESENVVNGNISPNLILYRADLEEVDYIFLYFFLTSVGGQKKIEKYISKTAKKTITGKDIKRIEIYCPPMELQNKFKAIYQEVRSMSRDLSITEDYDALFRSLIKKAFKGKLEI